ncbi:putative colanic acid biosynthesis acetyltransferase [soil metagenome]
MPEGKTKLSSFNNDWYNHGASFLKRGFWFCFNVSFFCSRFPFNGIKIAFLRLFGAEIGKNVIIRPGVNIKSPWFLKIADNVWIGENVWIDNLILVSIGSDCCISQGALLLTGNHDYKKSTFDLITNGITLEEGVWIGAKAVVCPGVICRSHALLTVASVATTSLESYSIYQGNPARKIRDRKIS